MIVAALGLSVDALRHRLIVSCQADEGGPLSRPAIMAAMAASAAMGGAGAIRACRVDDIRAIKRAVRVPVIGLTKRSYPHAATAAMPRPTSRPSA
jgi:N-acylglucosamine-6-phosphate 2-epimerase